MRYTDKERLSKCKNSLQMLAYEAEKESPYEFIITCGHRTIEQQKIEYAKGRTSPGKKVTNCDGIKKKSNHNYIPSRAFDYAVKIDGRITWEEKYYEEMVNHFKYIANKLGIKITCGGDWEKMRDLPHIEVKL